MVASKVRETPDARGGSPVYETGSRRVLKPVGAAKPPTSDLLFTFPTNQAGFDTGFTISNTGADPFGTAGSAGSCVITFYANGVGTPVVIPGTIAPGATATFSLSIINPGFQGYAVAHCENMAFAHGVAVVSDLGARNLAVSYPALVLPAKRPKKNEQLLP